MNNGLALQTIYKKNSLTKIFLKHFLFYLLHQYKLMKPSVIMYGLWLYMQLQTLSAHTVLLLGLNSLLRQKNIMY